MTRWNAARRMALAVVGVSLLAACPGGGGPADGGADAGGPFTLNGRVNDQNQLPIVGATIVVRHGDGTASTTTDSSGGFTAADVTAPYEVLVHVAADNQVIDYRNLHRADPVLTLLFGAGDAGFAATLEGTASGTYPLGGNEEQQVLLDSPSLQSTAGLSSSTNSATGEFTLQPVWTSPALLSGTIHALRWNTSSGLPSSYVGYGRRDNVTASNGGLFTGQDVTLSPIASSSIGGNIVVPAGYTVGNKQLRVGFGGPGYISVVSDSSPGTAVNFVTPVINGATFAVVAGATPGAGSQSALLTGGLTANASGLTFNVPPIASATTPADGATGVNPTTTQFTWTPTPNAMSLVNFAPDAAGFRLLVVTDETSITLPDLSPLGLTYPANAEYAWQVLCVGPSTSADERVAPPLGLTNGISGASAVFFITNAAGRSFTFAP